MKSLRLEARTPSRLHFGLIDLSGELGRVDGGTGVALKDPGWHLTVSIDEEDHKSGNLIVSGPQMSLVESMAHYYFQQRGIPTPSCRFDVWQAIPSHVGLGSKTQLCLAIGSALEMLYQRTSKKPPVRQIACLMKRGGTSGIGVSSFANGGFCVDCGHSFGPGKQKEDFLPSRASHASPPPVVLNRPFPEEWSIVLAIPNVSKGASGEPEIEIFSKNCPLDSHEAGILSRAVLMQMIPAVLEKDIDAFGESLKKFQNIGFKRIEILQQHPIVRDLIMIAERAGSTASGMSSFGPTTFCIVDGESWAKEIRDLWQDKMDERMGGEALVTLANNNGASLSITANHVRPIEPVDIQTEVES